jgi:hypothetical protein
MRAQNYSCVAEYHKPKYFTTKLAKNPDIGQHFIAAQCTSLIKSISGLAGSASFYIKF